MHNATNRHRQAHISRQRSDSSINNRSVNTSSPGKSLMAGQDHRSLQNTEQNNNIYPFKYTGTHRMTAKGYKTKKSSKNSKRTNESASEESMAKSTPDVELFNLRIHDSDNDLEILSHQKTKKLISTDINSVISGSATPVRGQPAKYKRPSKRCQDHYFFSSVR